MLPIQGLHYKLAGLYKARALHHVAANRASTTPVEAGTHSARVAELDSEIAHVTDLIAKDKVAVAWIENISAAIEKEKDITSSRRLAITHLEAAADRLRRGLGDVPPPTPS